MDTSNFALSPHIYPIGLFIMSTVLNFDDSDSSDEEVEQHIEVQSQRQR